MKKMQNENNKKRFAGKGYYIALIACIAAVGISGYVFLKTARSSAVEPSPSASAEVTQEVQTAATSQVKTSAEPSSENSAAPTEETTKEDSAATAATNDLMEDAYETAMGETDPIVAWPLNGDVMATFSQDTLTYSQTMADWRTHEGLDIAAEAGTLVSAAQSGTVTAVYEDDFLGTVVVVSHSGDLATLYANLADDPSVSVGDSVMAGQPLGQVGSSALLETAEPPHLHFEVFENGSAVDPLSYLPE